MFNKVRFDSTKSTVVIVSGKGIGKFPWNSRDFPLYLHYRTPIFITGYCDLLMGTNLFFVVY